MIATILWWSPLLIPMSVRFFILNFNHGFGEDLYGYDCEQS